MAILIDTNILIEIHKGREELKPDYVISVISLLEFLLGVKNEENWKRSIEETLPVIPLDNKVVLMVSKLYKKLKRRGELIDIRNLIIGATAIVYNIPLKSKDKDFEKLIEFGLVLI